MMFIMLSWLIGSNLVLVSVENGSCNGYYILLMICLSKYCCALFECFSALPFFSGVFICVIIYIETCIFCDISVLPISVQECPVLCLSVHLLSHYVKIKLCSVTS